MNDENELLKPLATEAGQEAIVRAIRDISSLEYAVRAEQAASQASAKAGEASQSALEASEAEDKAKDWATKTDTYVEQQIITIPPAQEGEEPTTETINLYSAKYYAALAQDIYNNMSFDSVPTENSTNMVNSGTVYSALDLKADKSTTYTKTEVDTALGAKADQSTTYTKTEVDTALSNVQSTLTFDSTPTANSTNPVTSGGIYTALQNVNIDIDDEITEDSDNPVTSAAIYEALQNFTPSGGGGGIGNASGITREELWSGNWSSGDIELSNPITDYDFIEIIYYSQGEGRTQNYSRFVSSADLLNYTSESSHATVYGYGTYFYDFYVYTPTVLRRNSYNGSGWTISGVYGIKFSKNLSEQMYSNVLYENSSGWTSGSITLSDDFTNYDFIEFVYGEQNIQNQRYSKVIPSERLRETEQDNKQFVIDGVDNQYILFSIQSNSFTIIGRNNYQLYKINGIKFAKGGYSGIVSDARMTVKGGTYTLTESVQANVDFPLVQITFDSPMPDNNYEVLLTKHSVLTGGAELAALACNKTSNGFQIKFVQTSGTAISGNGVDWIAIRPNSYTREGMVEDVLFSNASGVSSGTINLSGNISDYDLIQIDVKRPWGNSGLYGYCSQVYKSADLVTLIGGNDSVAIFGYDNEYSEFKVSTDSSLLIVNGNKMPFTSVTGIKFGRYVSGVAVDTTVTENSDAVVTSGAVYDALQNIPTGSGDVTTNTNQNITGTKTFVGSKKVAFKQSTANDKLGFTLFGNTGTERGYLEFNPTNTVDGVAGLMTLGNYATSAAALTQVGFRRYSNISGQSGAYNLLMPMVADAKSPFSLTTTYQNFYLPLGFTDGTTTVRTAKTGVVDLSPLLQAAINSITNANGVSY